MQNGTLYVNAEVEPSLAVNPGNPDNVVASWQQDRWSNGGSQGIVSARSLDGGLTWSTRPLAYSRCAGGTVANGGDFDRASNPWTAFSRNGVAQQLALSFTGVVFGAGSQSAMLVSRSTDGGATWGATTTLVRDGAGFFNDKGAITTDPNDAAYVYATWDRLVATGGGPTMFARSVDNGATWSAARPVFDPGLHSQTIGNVIVVLPNGTLVDLFTRIDFAGTTQTATLMVIRSTDRGTTWSAPTKVADLLSIGTRDPVTRAPVRDAAILGAIAADTAGRLFVIWQDARFSGGARNAIATSQSTDGGFTWTTPSLVNITPSQAFDPSVTVRSDGVIGVLYYDFRDDASDDATLLTGLWLARSTDGFSWTETRLSGPFDLNFAPRTDAGLFLGDYEALGATPSRFVPLFTVTNADAANRTDIYGPASALLLAREANAGVRERPLAVADAEVAPALRAEARDALLAALRARWPGWSRPSATP